MVAEEVMQIINMLAEKLGVAAEKVYPMLITQAQVFRSTFSVGWWIFIIALVLFIGSVIIIAVSNPYDDIVVLGEAGIVLFGIVMIGSGVYLLSVLNEYFTALHNPEWWAIEYVAKLLK